MVKFMMPFRKWKKPADPIDFYRSTASSDNLDICTSFKTVNLSLKSVSIKVDAFFVLPVDRAFNTSLRDSIEAEDPDKSFKVFLTFLFSLLIQLRHLHRSR